MGDKPDTGTKQDERRLDLSVPQVAGSALAAIAAAVLASQLGVYGTIVGAGVVSVVATCGGTVFQHLFRRTGEQLRDATVQSLPKARRDPGLPAYEDAREGEFGAATVHGTRLRGWKRSALGAAVVFAVAMGGITTYELASGAELSGGKGGTTFGSVVSGGGGGKSSQRDSEKGSEPDRRTPHTPGTGTDGGTSSSPDPGQGTGGTPATGGTTPTPTPTPTPSTSTGGTPTPPPSPPPSTGSGGATPDTGPATGSAATPPAT
ncbi:hypothetical protein [Streptomyces melanogenes]|uniref:hypothetical protein n=1 Tax=Streptomyces melanogenes TaxID=67326 RepID=UPI0019AAE431|nr:hypothetical protein [Streptomyces melanogenes]GGP65572.1 hypothetical protein GCM10010278_48620 [Streptomyces melanogenes]